VCRGFGADFCCKSEIRTPALWGRKAGTDRVREGIPEGFRPTEQACALWRRGSAEALAVARTLLEPAHQAAYVEYDRLVKKDKDALKSARVEKILGAIHNNLEQHPELKDRLKELVKEWK